MMTRNFNLKKLVESGKLNDLEKLMITAHKHHSINSLQSFEELMNQFAPNQLARIRDCLNLLLDANLDNVYSNKEVIREYIQVRNDLEEKYDCDFDEYKKWSKLTGIEL